MVVHVLNPEREIEIAIRNGVLVRLILLDGIPGEQIQPFFAPHILYRTAAGELYVCGVWAGDDALRPILKKRTLIDLAVARIGFTHLTSTHFELHPNFDRDDPKFSDILCFRNWKPDSI